jgi:arylsulfatase A-like enzyme/Flp pilus assembly protein TadD
VVRRATVLLVAIASLAAAVACGPRPRGTAAGRPFVLISVDTLRSDHLPTYGYSRLQAPAFDALARDSIVFERAFSHYPLTLPSHASVFTGLLPPAHGVRNNKGYALADAHETLAERLRAAGYRTAGFVSSMVLRPDTGIAQGFDTYDAPGDQGRRVFSQRRGDATIARAEAWLSGLRPGERFFLFLHLFDPHTPYDPPPPFDHGYPSAYDGEIGYTDAVLGRFLAALRERGLYDDTLIVLLSDHGEGLGDHVEREHGLLLHREALQVPLFVKLPGQARAGERIKTPAALSDVAATALGQLALTPTLGAGQDLLGPRPPAADRAIYGETWFTREQYGWSELRSVISGDGHYVDAPRPELYDWARDPAERENLAPRIAVPARFTDAVAALGRGTATTKAVSRDEEERLAALGYVGGPSASAAPPSPGRGPDPKDHISQVVELWGAMEKIGKTDSLAPENEVKRLLGELGLRHEYLSRTIAYNMLRAGRPAAALDVLRPFADSREPATLETLGEVLLGLGRAAPARAAFERAIAVDPNDAAALRGLGMVSLSAGRPAEARPHLERAVAADASLADAWNALGVARAQTGDLPGAITAWRKTVEIDPEAGLAWFNLAVSLEKAGDRRGATAALEKYLPLARGGERAEAEAMLRRIRTGA